MNKSVLLGQYLYMHDFFTCLQPSEHCLFIWERIRNRLLFSTVNHIYSMAMDIKQDDNRVVYAQAEWMIISIMPYGEERLKGHNILNSVCPG